MTQRSGDRPPSPLAAPEPWDLVADAYTAELLPLFESFARKAVALAALPPAPRILDVATGPGTLAVMALEGGATVTAIDFSPAMIANLRRRAAQAGSTAIDARVADGQALPLEDDSYDGAFSMFGLMFFPDRASGFRELRRVLRPGRRAVVSSWAPFTGPYALVMDAIRTLLPGLPSEGKRPLGEPDDYLSEMKAAGFSKVDVHTITYGLTASSLSTFWHLVQRTTAPLVLLRRKLGDDAWADVARAVFDKLAASLGEGPVDAPFTGHLGVGVK